MTHALRFKRVYAPAASTDGFRVLVDRLWPRGLTKAEAHVDLWLKEVAPSSPLRRWFHADTAARWKGFCDRYRAELAANDAVGALRDVIAAKSVTLLFGAKDPEHNHAAILAEFLTESGPPRS